MAHGIEETYMRSLSQIQYDENQLYHAHEHHDSMWGLLTRYNEWNANTSTSTFALWHYDYHQQKHDGRLWVQNEIIMVKSGVEFLYIFFNPQIIKPYLPPPI